MLNSFRNYVPPLLFHSCETWLRCKTVARCSPCSLRRQPCNTRKELILESETFLEAPPPGFCVRGKRPETPSHRTSARDHEPPPPKISWAWSRRKLMRCGGGGLRESEEARVVEDIQLCYKNQKRQKNAPRPVVSVDVDGWIKLGCNVERQISGDVDVYRLARAHRRQRDVRHRHHVAEACNPQRRRSTSHLKPLFQ